MFFRKEPLSVPRQGTQESRAEQYTSSENCTDKRYRRFYAPKSLAAAEERIGCASEAMSILSWLISPSRGDIYGDKYDIPPS